MVGIRLLSGTRVDMAVESKRDDGSQVIVVCWTSPMSVFPKIEYVLFDMDGT